MIATTSVAVSILKAVSNRKIMYSINLDHDNLSCTLDACVNIYYPMCPNESTSTNETAMKLGK